MYAVCHICLKEWDLPDSGVRYFLDEGVWECNDESECLGRRIRNDMMARGQL